MSIYLDWNATSPPHPDVIAAMTRALENSWANPSSVHGSGRRARAVVDDAREAIARLVGLHPRDVTLTSGGTEANNLAIASFTRVDSGARPALITSRLEHPSITRAAERAELAGALVLWVAPSSDGRIEPSAVADAISRAQREGATLRLITIQAVNHETGVIQPVAEIAALAHAAKARVLVDAVQAVGKIDASLFAAADLVTIAAHKIRGPKGIGALVTRPGVPIAPVLVGGAQERGIRPGTQDAAASAGFAVAADRARSLPSSYAKLADLRDRLEAAMLSLGAVRNGDAARAPHIVNASFAGWRGDELCAALDLEGVHVSSGSACAAGTAEPSPVITAIAGDARARSAVRASLGDATTSAEIDQAIAALRTVIARRR